MTVSAPHARRQRYWTAMLRLGVLVRPTRAETTGSSEISVCCSWSPPHTRGDNGARMLGQAAFHLSAPPARGQRLRSDAVRVYPFIRLSAPHAQGQRAHVPRVGQSVPVRPTRAGTTETRRVDGGRASGPPHPRGDNGSSEACGPRRSPSAPDARGQRGLPTLRWAPALVRSRRAGQRDVVVRVQHPGDVRPTRTGTTAILCRVRSCRRSPFGMRRGDGLDRTESEFIEASVPRVGAAGQRRVCTFTTPGVVAYRCALQSPRNPRKSHAGWVSSDARCKFRYTERRIG